MFGVRCWVFGVGCAVLAQSKIGNPNSGVPSALICVHLRFQSAFRIPHLELSGLAGPVRSRYLLPALTDRAELVLRKRPGREQVGVLAPSPGPGRADDGRTDARHA